MSWEIEKGGHKWKLRELDVALRNGYIADVILRYGAKEELNGLLVAVLKVGVEDVDVNVELKFEKFEYLGRKYDVLSDAALDVLFEKFPTFTDATLWEVVMEIMERNKIPFFRKQDFSRG